MRTLSDILEEKVYSAVNYLLALKIKPTLKYGKVTDIDEEVIDRLNAKKEKYKEMERESSDKNAEKDNDDAER